MVFIINDKFTTIFTLVNFKDNFIKYNLNLRLYMQSKIREFSKASIND